MQSMAVSPLGLSSTEGGRITAKLVHLSWSTAQLRVQKGKKTSKYLVGFSNVEAFPFQRSGLPLVTYELFLFGIPRVSLTVGKHILQKST